MLEKIAAAARNRATYRIGLLQDKAYRVMKRETAAALAPYKISTTEWAFLGLLHDERIEYPSAAAEELGIEAAFVTVMMRHLKKRGFIEEKKDATDSRRKCIRITKAGGVFVVATEREIRGTLRELIKGASPRALAEYLLILERVITNSRG